jgi:hypothetical protein
MQPKPAFSSLDRVSLVPTADSWAVRSGPAVSVALADSAGLWVSAPERASADRYVVGCDFLDLGKSAGPNDTSETRFNALKHGLTSEGICEVDDQRSYIALCRQLKRQYEPCGAVEQFLVQRVALGIIRVKRAAKLEADALTEYLHPPSHKPSLEDLQLRELMRDSERELIDPGLPAKLGSNIIETLCDRYGRYETAKRESALSCSCSARTTPIGTKMRDLQPNRWHISAQQRSCETLSNQSDSQKLGKPRIYFVL